MIGGVLFGVQFEMLDYVVTALLCAGLIFFTRADAQTSLEFRTAGSRHHHRFVRSLNPWRHIGIVLMTISVCSDALRLNLSERVLSSKTNARPVGELVCDAEQRTSSDDAFSSCFTCLHVSLARSLSLKVVLLGIVWTVGARSTRAVERRAASGSALLWRQRRRLALVSGERRAPWLVRRCARVTFVRRIARQTMGLCAFLGSLSMMNFVRLSSAYSMSLLGIVQMAFTIGFSVVQYRKPIGALHLLGGALFGLGLGVRALAQRRRRQLKRA